MAKCGKCDPHEICEECPEWIFTLADLIMCMMGLFVILWVLKPSPGKQSNGAEQQIKTDEWLETVGEIRGGFGWKPDPSSPDRVDQIILRKRSRMNGPGDGGQTQLEHKGAEGTDPLVTSVRQGAQAIVGGRLLYDAGDATLS